MCSGGLSFCGCCSAGPATNAPLQPSETQIPVSSYPHVFPRRHATALVDVTSATPDDVVAGQCCRSPARDSHEMSIGSTAWPLPSGVCACAVAAATNPHARQDSHFLITEKAG